MDGTTGEDDLLDSVVVTLDQEGWIVLDVGSALAFWQAYPKHNLGLLLQAEYERDKGLNKLWIPRY